MANYLQMRYTSDVERAGFTIESEPPDSGSVDHTLVWVRVRMSLSPTFTAPASFFISTPSGSIAYSNLVRLYMETNGDAISSLQAIVGFEVTSSSPFAQIDAYASSSQATETYMLPTSSYYGNNNILQRQVSTTFNRTQLMTNRPVDIVMLIGKIGSVFGGRIWVGPADGTYTQIISGTVINNNFSGTLAFSKIQILPNEGLYVGLEQTVRLFQWEVLDGITNPDPFRALAGTSTFTGSLSGSQIIGDDFSTYVSKSDFQLSVNNSTASNASDDALGFYNSNYYGYGGSVGFYDNGFFYASGSSFEFPFTPVYMPWRFVSSSTNTSEITSPFGGVAIWQLCDAQGIRMNPSKLIQQISGSWTGSLRGVPALGVFEYTSSTNFNDWESNASGGVIREWTTFPGTPVDLPEISMSLRSLVNATFDVPIPSRSYGISVDYSNYGFYPTHPINLSSSILDII